MGPIRSLHVKFDFHILLSCLSSYRHLLSFFFFYFLHESFWCMCVFEGVWVSRLSWFGCFCWFQFNVFTTFKQMFTSLVLQFLLHLLFRVVFIFVAISSSKYIFLLLLSLLLLLFLFLLILLYLFVGFIDGGDI